MTLLFKAVQCGSRWRFRSVWDTNLLKMLGSILAQGILMFVRRTTFACLDFFEVCVGINCEIQQVVVMMVLAVTSRVSPLFLK